MKYVKVCLIFLFTALTMIFFQNCSEVQFSSADDIHFVDENLNKNNNDDGSVRDSQSTDDEASQGDNSDGDEPQVVNPEDDKKAGDSPEVGENPDGDNSGGDSPEVGENPEENTPGVPGEDNDGDGDHDGEDDLEQYSCGDSLQDHKILICHVPSGNVGNAHNICIAKSALKAHIDKHGADDVYDYYGECK